MIELERYQKLKSEAGEASLDSREQLLDMEIQSVSDRYKSNSGQLDSCLAQMKTYRHFVSLSRNQTLNLETFMKEMMILNLQMESGEYEEAYRRVGRLQDLIEKMKANSQKRAELGLIEYDSAVIESWTLYSLGLEELKPYFMHMIDGREDEAEKQLEAADRLFTKTLEVGSQENLNENLNRLDHWYLKNIRVCMEKT